MPLDKFFASIKNQLNKIIIFITSILDIN